MPHTHFICEICQKRIPRGAAYVCISKNIEQYEVDIVDDEDKVEVIHSEGLITMCGGCGNRFDDELLVRLIQMTPSMRGRNLN